MPRLKKHHYIASLVLLMLIAGAVLVLRTDTTSAQAASPPTVVTSIYRVDNPMGANAFSATTTNSATFPFTVASADASQLLVVAAHGEKNDSTGCFVSSITYNGIALTQSVSSTTLNNGYNNCVALWYLDNPNAGTNNVVVTWTGTGILGKAASAVLLSGAGNAPNVTGAGTPCFSALAGGCSISNASVTTITDNSLVLDAVTAGNTNSGAPTKDASQTLVHTGFNQGTYDIRFGASTKTATAQGNVTMMWTGTYNRTAHIAVAVPPDIACANGIDDDGDGYTDASDPGCANSGDDDESHTAPTTFAVNDFVKVAVASTNIYPSATGNLSPTSNMTSSGTQSLNAAGKVVQSAMYGFTGAPAYGTGVWYWRVNFGSGTDGWVSASNLVKVCDGTFPTNTFEACFFDGVSTANINSISPPTLPGSALLLAQQSTSTISSPPVGTLYPAYSMNWLNGNITPAATSSYVYAIYRGKINLSGGSYVFHTYSDDGVKLFVNGATHINDWGVHNATNKYSIATTSLSGLTDIELWYREDGGGAQLNFGWTRYNQCEDGIDNDSPGDGLVDYPADPGCSSSSDDDEANTVSQIPSVIGSPLSVGANSTNQVTIANVSVPNGNSGRMLIVGVAAEDPNLADCAVAGVKYGTQQLTRVPNAVQSVGSATRMCAETWYLLDPIASSDTVTASTTGTVNYLVAGVIGLKNAKQSAPTPVNKSFVSSIPVTWIQTISNASGANILLVDTFGGGEGQVATTTMSGQISRWSQTQGGSTGMTAGGSTRALNSGNILSWNSAANVQRMAQIIIAIEPFVAGGGPAACADTLDNDSPPDGLIDFPNDPGCTSASDTDEYNMPMVACDDNVDNDNDTYIDLNDPGCYSLSDTSEVDTATTTTACNDNIDNDGDLYFDEGDPGCGSSSANSEVNRVSRRFSIGQRVAVAPPEPKFLTVVDHAGGCSVDPLDGFGDCYGNNYPNNPTADEIGTIVNAVPVFVDTTSSTKTYGRGSWYWEVNLDDPLFPTGYLVEDGLRLASQCEDGIDNDGVGGVDLADTDCSSVSDLSESNPIHEITGWAWSEHVGWISFSNPNGSGIDYGVDISSDGELSGYAWSGGGRGTSTTPDLGTGIGWISFHKDDLGGCPKAPCEARIAITTGKVTGWARACLGTYTDSNITPGTCATTASRSDGWDGWISLSKQANDSIEYGVTVSDCSYSGWAWGGDVIGWISFSGNQYSTLQYGVTGVGDGCLNPEDTIIACDWLNDPTNGQYVVDLLAPELEGLTDNQKKAQIVSPTSDRFLNSRYQSSSPSSNTTGATTTLYSFTTPVPPGYYDVWLSIYDDHTLNETVETNESSYLQLFTNGQSNPIAQSSAIFDIQDSSPWLYKIISKVDTNKYINTTVHQAQFVHSTYPSGGFPTSGDNDFWVLCALLREVGPSFELKLSSNPSVETSLAVVKPADATAGSWKSNPLQLSVQRNGGFTGNITLMVDSIYVKCVDNEEWCTDAEGDTLVSGTDYTASFANGVLSGATLNDTLTLTILNDVLPGKYGVKLKGWDSSGCGGPASCPNQDTITIDLDIRPDNIYTPR